IERVLKGVDQSSQYGMAYSLGNQVARALVNYAEKRVEEKGVSISQVKSEIAVSILKSIDLLSADFQKASETDQFVLARYLELFFISTGDSGEISCEVLSSFIQDEDRETLQTDCFRKKEKDHGESLDSGQSDFENGLDVIEVTRSE